MTCMTDIDLLIKLYGITECSKLIVPKIIEWMRNRDAQAKAELNAEKSGAESVKREESRRNLQLILTNTEILIESTKEVVRVREILKQIYGAREDLSKLKDKLDSTGPVSNQLDGLEDMLNRAIESLGKISTVQGEIRLLMDRNK